MKRVKSAPDPVAQRVDAYVASHPRSPAAVRRPKISHRNNVWIALLGASVQDGIVGLGLTVEAALRAFDAQYLNAPRPQTAA
jgi:hypothetical protein